MAMGAWTNTIPNSHGVGAAAGVVPTGWSIATIAGITIACEGGGEGYADFRVSGTNAGTSDDVSIRFAASNGISAVPGQAWNLYFNLSVLSGSLPSAYGATIYQRNAAQGFLAGANASQLFEVQLSSAVADTAYVQPVVRFRINNGTTHNFVVRISKPQLTQTAYKMSYAKTTAGAVTVPASSSTTGGNGTNTAMDARMQECLRGKTDGVEKTVNGNFDTDTAWTKAVVGTGAMPTWANGAYTLNRVDGSNNGRISQVGTYTVGDRYLIRVLGLTGGQTVQFRWGVSNNYLFSATITELETVCDGVTPILIPLTVGDNVVSSISIQRLLPIVFTAIASIIPGASSAQVTADANVLSVRGVVADLIYLSASGTIKASDGTNTATVTVTDGWLATDRLNIFVQPTAAGNQWKIGYTKNSDQTITWGSLATYKGTVTPGTHQRAALNGTLPMYFRLTDISNKILTDSQCLKTLRYPR